MHCRTSLPDEVVGQQKWLEPFLICSLFFTRTKTIGRGEGKQSDTGSMYDACVRAQRTFTGDDWAAWSEWTNELTAPSSSYSAFRIWGLRFCPKRTDLISGILKKDLIYCILSGCKRFNTELNVLYKPAWPVRPISPFPVFNFLQPLSTEN